MPPKRNQRRQTNKPPAAAEAPGAMAHCVFPQQVMVNILTRLPVKSILRFRSVCKPWCKLFAAPRFVKLHHAKLAENPENQSVFIYSVSEYQDNITSLLKIDSEENEPVALDNPYPEILFKMDVVGSCNGLVCMGCPPLGMPIILWNPSLKLHKFIRLAKVVIAAPEQMVSLGFGYDGAGDDFKVVRIVRLKKKGGKMTVGAEVYSSTTDSWRKINVGFQFNVLWTKNDAVVNGNPYWVAKAGAKVKSPESDVGEFLVCFDVKKMEFRALPLSGLDLRGGVEVPLVDWKGSLGALVCAKNGEEWVESVDVWVLDDGGNWGKKHTFGPIDSKVDRVLQCSNDGRILGECPDGKLFVFNPVTGVVKKFAMDGARKRSLVILGYAESLTLLKGMEKVAVKNEDSEGSGGDEHGSNLRPEEWVIRLSRLEVGYLRFYMQHLNFGSN